MNDFSFFFFYRRFHFMWVDGQKISYLFFLSMILQISFQLFPFFFMSSSTWLIRLVLGRPLSLFPSSFISNAHLGILVILVLYMLKPL
jgi:hypothetical protein